MSDNKFREELIKRLEQTQETIDKIQGTGKFYFIGDALGHKREALQTLVDFYETPVTI